MLWVELVELCLVFWVEYCDDYDFDWVVMWVGFGECCIVCIVVLVVLCDWWCGCIGGKWECGGGKDGVS